MKFDSDSNIWFSYDQKKYTVNEITRELIWSNVKRWNWPNCHFSIVGMKDNVRLVVRRQKKLDRTNKGAEDKVNLMLGLVITKIYEPEFGLYGEPAEHNNDNQKWGPERNCWFIKLENLNFDEKESYITNACIWKWSDVKNTCDPDIFSIFQKLKSKQNKPDKNKIFDVESEPTDRIYPVIYQPRIDALENYVTEIYWSKKRNSLEFSIVFKDEQLRRWWIFDWVYRKIRRWKYGRVQDLESLTINDARSAQTIQFPNIFSDFDDLKSDTKHGDNTFFGLFPAKKHEIAYFYSNECHPVVFVNTANHAMAEHDNNHQFWKWEYAGWETDSPIKVKQMSHEEVDQMLKDRAGQETKSKNQTRSTRLN